MWWMVLAQQARACDKQPVRVEVPADGVTALAIEGWTANVTLVPAEGDALLFDGVACDDVRIRVRGSDNRRVARAHIDPRAALILKIGVPSGVQFVTFSEHNGPMAVDGLSAHVAVVSSLGSVDVDHGGTLRVSYSEGDLRVDTLSGDLVVDRLVGAVSAQGVEGDATVERVTGDVSVQDVSGDLDVSGGDGDVSHGGVRGSVSVR